MKMQNTILVWPPCSSLLRVCYIKFGCPSMDKLKLPAPISEIRTTAMLLILNYRDVAASSDMILISSFVKLHPTFWNLTVGNQTTKRMAPEAYVSKKANTCITMKLTLMRLAAMLEHGETTVLRQRSCTTKLHTATHNTAITEGTNGCTHNYQLNSIYVHYNLNAVLWVWKFSYFREHDLQVFWNNENILT